MKRIIESSKLSVTKIRPKFDLKYFCIRGFLFFAPFVLLSSTSTDGEFVSTVSMYLAIYFFVALGVVMPMKSSQYCQAEFIINHDKVSYINSFINYRRKDIKFDEIQEVILKMGFIQKRFGLGDIEFITNASSPYAHGINKAGLTFFNIENPQEVYDLVQQRIAEHKKKR